jgi:putative PIN family toxin of toxin-antitoxin system
MIAAVFDCMVYLQAATNDRSPAFACLALVETNHVKLYLSPAILAEVRDVLTRPKIQRKFPHLTQERADTFVQKLATLATLVNNVPNAGVPLRDPDDLPYLNLAVTVNAEYIVSRDKDLLDLMKDAGFVSKQPQLLVVDPVAFLGIARPTQTP